jgi:arsenite methyltransferase
VSRALAIRNAALRLAARDGSALSLGAPQELFQALLPLVNDALAAAQSIVLIGTSTPGLVAYLVFPEGSRKLTVVENDPALIPDNVTAAVNRQGSTLQHACEPLDLRIDPQKVDQLVAAMKPSDYAAYRAVGARVAQIAATSPLIADSSVDLVIIDCMVNRLARDSTARLLGEAFRVLRRGGRLLDICLLADESPKQPHEPADMGVWSAVRLPLETEAGTEIIGSGFHGLRYHPLLRGPVQTVNGTELRAFVLEAFKGKQGVCLDQGHAVIYKGPWSAVLDDDGHRYVRGERTAVCAKTYELLMREPYAGAFLGLPAYVETPLEQAPVFDCNTPAVRSPAVTKGKISLRDVQAGPAAGNSDCCPPSPSDKGTAPCCG